MLRHLHRSFLLTLVAAWAPSRWHRAWWIRRRLGAFAGHRLGAIGYFYLYRILLCGNVLIGYPKHPQTSLYAG